MFKVQYQFFNSEGEQKSKVLEASKLETIIKKMDKHLKTVELYHISHVSLNLVSYDFTQHGEHFKGWL